MKNNKSIKKENMLNHEIQYIPFNKLFLSSENVRKKQPTAIEELAMNIQEEGLLQNLIVSLVTKGEHKGKYAVVAGGRRWLAMGLLVQQEKWEKDIQVPCKVMVLEQAISASLSENEQREMMHPADRFDAYKKLIDAGKTIEYVAAVHGVKPRTIEQYLKLADISPKIFELFRQDQINLPQMQALTLENNHDIQEQVWFGAHEWHRQPSQLAQRLTQKDIDSRSNRLARFVGLSAYEAAGGPIRRDLFSTSDSGYLCDADLLHRLAKEKFEITAEKVHAEGWGWVEINPDLYYVELSKFSELPVTNRELSAEEMQQRDALQEQEDELREKMEMLDIDDEEEYEEYKKLDRQLDAIEQKYIEIEEATKKYDAEAMKHAGTMISLDNEANVVIHRGLVKPADKTKVLPVEQADNDEKPKEKPIHSEKLKRRLSAHRSAAMQATLAVQPDIALPVLIDHLASQIFYGGYTNSAIHVQATTFEYALQQDAEDLKVSPAWKAIEKERATWKTILPASQEELFDWLLTQTQKVQIELLAFCVAMTINGSAAPRPEFCVSAMDKLANAVKLDMSEWWKPTGAGYFDHVSKKHIAQLIAQEVSPKAGFDIADMKKAVAAEMAERYLVDTKWVPDNLRCQRAV